MIASNAFNFTLLENTQQRNLYVHRKIADFVQEERASIGSFEPTQSTCWWAIAAANTEFAGG
jgi:hypothetical protein